jgi:tetratricopeptide (TPR) repeat protein
MRELFTFYYKLSDGYKDQIQFRAVSYEDAISKFIEVLRHDPKNHAAMYELSKIAFESGNMDKSIEYAQNAIKKYGPAVDQLMNSAPQARNTFNQLFTVYINKKIVAGDLNNLANGFMDFVESRPMTDKMKAKIAEHLNQNKDAILGAFTIWSALYTLKMSVVNQLNKAAEVSPVKGYLQDGTETHEGFVANGLKFVDRMGFSRQNLAGR